MLHNTKESINFWVGYTVENPIVHEICKFSLEEFDINVMPTPGYVEKNTTNPFSRTRFVTPLVDAGFSDSDWVFFSDDDFVFLDNPMQLIDTLDDSKVVYVCKHPRYTSKAEIKMDGKKQNNYMRKNWSSFMIFNKKKFPLSIKDIFAMQLKDLHQFIWCNENDIGEIPLEWNWLVGEYAEGNENVKGLHYTLGGPWYKVPYPSHYNQKWKDFKKIYDTCF